MFSPCRSGVDGLYCHYTKRTAAVKIGGRTKNIVVRVRTTAFGAPKAE